MVNKNCRINCKLRSRHFAPKEAQPTVLEMSRRSHSANSNHPDRRQTKNSLTKPERGEVA